MDVVPRYILRKNVKLRRCQKEDIFSRLPDEVIISHILSRLTPREAGKCCFVSRRWASLLKQIISCKLIFSCVVKSYTTNVRKERERFVSWVNKILDLPQLKPAVDQFIVRSDLDSSYSCDINKWLNFALRKGVERLELDLSPYLDDFSKDYYEFPGIETLSTVLGFESNHGINLNTSCCVGLRHLRDICFKHVNVDGDAIEYMLSKCCFLERLCVKSSETLINLKVCGESVGLKHLEIVDCENAESIKISVSSLISLKYLGRKKALHIEYAPLLSDLCIGGEYCRNFLRRGARDFTFVSQLKKLKLNMSCKVVKESVRYPLTFQNFLSLEQLEVKMEMYNGLFLLWPTILIKAAPSLQRLAIQLKQNVAKLGSMLSKCCTGKDKIELVNQMDTVVIGSTPGLSGKRKSSIKSASREAHSCLKVIEIRCFLGNKSDLKLARHLLGMPFQSLEKIVLVTSPDTPIKMTKLGKKYQERSRERANLVRRWLPSSTQLVVV